MTTKGLPTVLLPCSRPFGLCILHPFLLLCICPVVPLRHFQLSHRLRVHARLLVCTCLANSQFSDLQNGHARVQYETTWHYHGADYHSMAGGISALYCQVRCLPPRLLQDASRVSIEGRMRMRYHFDSALFKWQRPALSLRADKLPATASSAMRLIASASMHVESPQRLGLLGACCCALRTQRLVLKVGAS